MWLIIGLVVGGGLLGLEFWTRNRGMVVTWYDRLIGAIGVLLLLLTLQFFFSFQAEQEPAAANVSLLMLGLPALVLLAVAASLIWRRRAAG